MISGDKAIIGSTIPEEDIEKIASEAVARTYKKACEYLLHDFYDVCGDYLYEHFSHYNDRIWREISRQIICGYSNGKWSKYDHKDLRTSLLREHKEEIVKQLNADLLEENKKLKADLQHEREWNRR